MKINQIFQRAQTEAVTFLGNQESSRSLYAIPGLDYVAHEDIIPYTSAEKTPLQHELFDKFLEYDVNKGKANNILQAVCSCNLLLFFRSPFCCSRNFKSLAK